MPATHVHLLKTAFIVSCPAGAVKRFLPAPVRKSPLFRKSILFRTKFSAVIIPEKALCFNQFLRGLCESGKVPPSSGFVYLFGREGGKQMQIKRLAALSLAAILATTMLTACPWDKENGNSDDDSQITTDENRPGHTGSDDNDDASDDTSDDDDSKVTITEDENGNKIEKGDGYTRTETPGGKVSYTVTNAAGLVKWGTEVNAGNGNIDCTLLADITMPTGVDWTPVGTTPNTNFYNGTFDGNGKCIENLQVNSSGSGGLFAYVGPDGCVKNLTLNTASWVQ